MRGSRFFRSAALVLGMALVPFAAAAVSFSGTDDNVQFTAYGSTGGTGTPGVFTFFDSDDAAPARGTVTAADGPTGLIGGQIDLEMLLDSGFNTAGSSIGAPFGSTGGNEIIVWDSAGTTALAVFDITFVNLRNANGLNASNVISFGDPEGSADRVDSQITLVGGTMAGALGGVGHLGALSIILDPDPALADTFPAFLGGYAGYLDDSFTGGATWAITMTPEPGTGLLVGSALLGMGLHGRWRRRR